MSDVMIQLRGEQEFTKLLNLHDFEVEELGSDVYSVTRGEELPVFIKIDGTQLYFEVDMGNVSEIASVDFYEKVLDLNTEVLPVSFGINSTNPGDPRLVLVESRDLGDLCDKELLGVFDALELAAEKAEELIEQTLTTMSEGGES